MARYQGNSRLGSIIRGIVVAFLLVFIFIATLATAVLLLTGRDFRTATALQKTIPAPIPTPTVIPEPLVTPIAAAMTTFRSVALGFAIDYPGDWLKEEKTLQVVFSPTRAGLDPKTLADRAIWVGIPADETSDPGRLIARALTDFSANAQIIDTSSMDIAAQSWLATQVSFENETSGRAGIARLVATNRNEVGYFIVAVAPAEEWPAMEPIFQGIIQSFRFTEEVVIRPTDATPPPTPTPTPTPQIYVVQSGDTLGAIAVKFGVSIEAIANRNGLDRPEYIRSGQKLIIPTKR
jgi:LysM repeat protein